jgi:hypothetical protein
MRELWQKQFRLLKRLIERMNRLMIAAGFPVFTDRFDQSPPIALRRFASASVRSDVLYARLMLWTTRYMDAALNLPPRCERRGQEEDPAGLSPLSQKCFNTLGRCHLVVPEEVLRATFAPVRVPEAG